MVLIGLLGLLLMAIHLPIVDNHMICINLEWHHKQMLYMLHRGDKDALPMRDKKYNCIIIDNIEDDSELQGKNL